MLKFVTLLCFAVILNALAAFGQDSSCRKSTEGTDFWFGFMEGRNYQVGHYNEITLSSSYTCSYKIYIGKSTNASFTGTVTPNVPLKITIDWTLVEATGSETIQNKAIHLVSDNPLNLYALNWSDSSSEVALIFPSTSLGSEYYTMCYTPHISGNGINSGSGRNSEFLLVASEDNTSVTITPTKTTDKGKPANVSFQITLNKGELYQVQSENLPVPLHPGQGDLTGSYITSDKPIAVYSGSLSTTVPGDASVSAWDHLYEQMPPIQAWGRKFIAVPLKTRHEDTYRILAASDNTTIRIGSKTPTVLNKGQYYEFSLLYTEPSLIESDKPILLAQFSNSNSVDATWTNKDGDPFMVIVSPVNQTREKVAFVAYDSPKINSKFFINVIVKDDAIGNIMLDNVAVAFTSISGTGYSYAQVSLVKGNHYIASTVAGKGFIAYVYGFGGVEAYGYGVGFNLDVVLDLGSNINASSNKLLIRCDGTSPLTLNAGNAFKSYLWSTGDTTSTIQASNAGWYKVQVATSDGCQLQDSVQLQVDKPLLSLGNDTTICNPASLILDANKTDEFTSYAWTTPSGIGNKPTFLASVQGIYSVLGTNKYGCKSKDSISVSFTNKPIFNFTKLDTLICGETNSILDVTADRGNFTVQRLSDNFIFNSLNVGVPSFGTYAMKVKVTDEFTCFADTIVKLGFHKTPTIDFSIDSTTCYNYNLDVTYAGNADLGSKYVWVFGGDTIVQGIDISSYLIPLGINRTTRDLKLKVTDLGCSVDKILHDIKVIPNLEVSVLDSLGCEPFTTKFHANNTETVSYDWDFGDGQLLGGVNADPTHTYQHDGYYPVSLKVTTNKGCTNQVKIDSMVYVAPIPTAGFTELPNACLDLGNNSVSYLGTGDILAKYYWNLSALDPIEIVQNPNFSQGPLVFNLLNKPQTTIKLNVVTKYGCKSDTASLLLKRIPDFTLSTESSLGCTPLETTFKGVTTDPVDRVNYTWDFGDGTLGSGSQTTHIYGVPGNKYNILLTALSETTGCTDTIQRNQLVWAYPKPVAKFSLDHSVVYYDKPTVTFTDESIGSSSYLWDFGDQLTSTIKDPVHFYSKIGHKGVLETVTNDFGCTDTTSTKLLVAFDRIFPPTGFSPNASEVVNRIFTISSEGIDPIGYHFTVLSRWGDVVYESIDEIKGWDGKTKNGNYAPSSVYVWTLDYKDFLGRRHRQTGTVTLVY